MKEAKVDRGTLKLDSEECKGCGLCVEACKPRVLRLSDRLNRLGYRPVQHRGSGCTGCGICYMVCPEPSAIAVLCAAQGGESHAQTHEGQ